VREPEPPPPVVLPALRQEPKRAICWSDVVADIEKDRIERDKAPTDQLQRYDVAEPEAA
jgi:hypothetical protein